MIDFKKPEYVNSDGVMLAVYRGGPEPDATDKPALVFLHGWPDVAFTWKAQMEALAAEGYPVIAADGRGFGRSDAPKGKSEYTMAKLTGDIAAVLDHYGLADAVLVGHDWGAIILWQTPFYIGERVRGLAGLSVPLLPHYPVDAVTLFRQTFGDSMYIVRFQTEGAAEPVLERDLRETFRFFLRKPGGNPKEGSGEDTDFAFEVKNLDLISLLEAGEEHWGGTPMVSEEELDYYVDAYSRNGMTGPLHYYRNMPANWEAQKQFLVDGKLPIVEKPCLQFTGALDRACPPTLTDGMENLCTPFERIDYTDCGHWVQQEKADEVNAALLDWLKRHF